MAWDPKEPSYFTLRIPLANNMKFMSLNDRYPHWAVKAKFTKQWHQATLYQLSRLDGPLPRPLPPCTIRSLLIVQVHRGRDPHNFTATVKPIVDILAAIEKLPPMERVAARQFANCWPDDDANWIDVETPYIEVNRQSTRGIIIRAVPKER